MIATVLRQHGHTNGSGAVLARALGISHASPRAHRKTRQDRFIINWGVTTVDNWKERRRVLSNHQEAVAVCVNKLQTLDVLLENDVPTIEWSTGCVNMPWPDYRMWLREDGKIVARDVLNGHSGAGVRVVRNEADIGNSPLYTRYFKKDAEYRVHVAFGEVILIQQKRRGKNYAELTNNDRDRALIRTNGNGWTFCITDLDCDSRNYRGVISDLALRAAQAVGINHGAVDILVRHTRTDNRAVVCEINTAPALRNPSTLAAYVRVFREKIQGAS